MGFSTTPVSLQTQRNVTDVAIQFLNQARYIPPSDNLEHHWPTVIHHLLNSVQVWKERENPEPTNETVVSIFLGSVAFIESSYKSLGF